MTIRRPLTFAATLALAITGVALPYAGAWDTATPQASAVAVRSDSSPANVATTGHQVATTGHQVDTSTSVTAPTRRRFRSRITSHDPVSVVIALVVLILAFGGYYLFRYLSTQGSRRQQQTVNYNGPAGPQYGVTADIYGGPQYPQTGTPMNSPIQQANEYGMGGYGNYYGSGQAGYPPSGPNGPYAGPNGTYGPYAGPNSTYGGSY